MRFHSCIRTAAGCALMILGTLAVVSRPSPSRWTGREEQFPSGQPAPAVQQLTQTKSSALLTFATCYTQCGHVKQSSRTVSGAADPVRLELHYSGWQLQSTSDGFSLRRSIDQLCPDHILARRENGRLCLYQNKEGGSTLTHIALLTDPLHSSHGEQIAHELTEGVIFDNLEALERYLESLNS